MLRPPRYPCQPVLVWYGGGACDMEAKGTSGLRSLGDLRRDVTKDAALRGVPQVVKYSDPADRLIIIVEGRVDVEFDHSTIVQHPMELKHGDFIGDIAILGNRDWGSSTCFNMVLRLGSHSRLPQHASRHEQPRNLEARAERPQADSCHVSRRDSSATLSRFLTWRPLLWPGCRL
jgi:CRP-like cAMP-binding protein